MRCKSDPQDIVGDRVKYNHSNEVVILKIEGNYALIQFDSGTKICTNLNGLKKIPQVCIVERQGGCIKNDLKAVLTVSASGTVYHKYYEKKRIYLYF